MKLSLFQQYLLQKKISLVYFAVPDPAITYFTQMEPSHGFLQITPKTAALWITALDKKPYVKGITVKLLRKKSKNGRAPKNIKKIGINKTQLTVQQLEQVQKLFPKAKIVDVSQKLTELRREKTAVELSYLQKACAVTSAAFNALCQELPKKTLPTEQDVAFFLERYIRSHGCTLAFPTIVAMGKNAATPHHLTSLQKLHSGFLLVDFGAAFAHYCADMSRTIYLGTPSAPMKKMYDLLLHAQQQTIKAISKDIALVELNHVARTALGMYQQRFIHSLGHGIGIEVHESPSFTEEYRVRPDVPFTIEPGIYIPNKFGMRIEDTLYFDGTKVMVLTTAPKELICIRI